MWRHHQPLPTGNNWGDDSPTECLAEQIVEVNLAFGVIEFDLGAVDVWIWIVNHTTELDI